ncbi:hypothetical protein LCGC14_2707990, partial [marine sediment metagenome]
DYAWFEANTLLSHDWGVAVHNGRDVVLLSTKPQQTMLATDEGPRRWRVEKVEVIKDPQDRPAIGVQFDQSGGQRMGALSEAHLKMPMAMLIDDRVVCMPRLMSKVTSQVQITGNFNARETAEIAEALILGMVDREEIEPGEIVPEEIVPEGDDGATQPAS